MLAPGRGYARRKPTVLMSRSSMARRLALIAIASFSALAVAACGHSGASKPSAPAVGSAALAMSEATAHGATPEEQARKGCLRLNARQCYFEGMALQSRGQGEQARGFFARACDLGEMEACYDLALLYEDGVAGVEKDVARARQLYQKACDAPEPDPTACSNLGLMYKTGSGVEVDAEAAVAMYERACELGSHLGCTNLAGRLVAGDGVERDVSRAGELVGEACRQGFFDACGPWLALAARGCPDGARCENDAVELPEQAQAYAETCVEAGDPVACAAMAAVLERGYGGIEQDPAEALARFEQACASGVQLACYKAADYYQGGVAGEPDPGRAAALYASACEAGFANACQQLGVAKLEAREVAEGFGFIQRACEAGQRASCRSIEYACHQGQRAACELRADEAAPQP